MMRVLRAVLLLLFGVAAHGGELARHTFYLEGGYFYGPGPIVPDTQLPHGTLSQIRFDAQHLRGYCEFANDGTPAGVLSDKRTRINQNIDAGKLLIGGGTSPVLLTAVDGGPHHGTEQYYLDEQYRFVWRVDIALDPGFAEGIIRLDDFVLNTGVVRVGRSLQSQAGQPGGYDQAGSLEAGEYLAGRVGDFDQDNFLDGVLVAAPNVPLAADMLPGAPVGNRRGFRTDVRIPPQISTELMLRGALHLREPLRVTLTDQQPQSYTQLLSDFQERIAASSLRAAAAAEDTPWRKAAVRGDVTRFLRRLERLQSELSATASVPEASVPEASAARLDALFAELHALISEVAHLNARSGLALPKPADPTQKSY